MSDHERVARTVLESVPLNELRPSYIERVAAIRKLKEEARE